MGSLTITHLPTGDTLHLESDAKPILLTHEPPFGTALYNWYRAANTNYKETKEDIWVPAMDRLEDD